MLSNDDVQASLVAYLKTKGTITAFLSSISEIKEDQWQGVTFTYPAVRVRLGTQFPILGQCPSTITFSILCYSESPSSKEADDLAGEVNAQLHGTSFNQDTVRFTGVNSTGLIPAIREDRLTWRSEATFKAIIQTTT